MSHSAQFLYSQEPQQEQSRHAFWRNLKRVLFVVLILGVLYGAVALVVAFQISADLYDGRDKLVSARDLVLELEMEKAQDSLARAQDYFDAADKKLNIIRSASFLPVIGSMIEQGDALFLSAIEIIDSFSDLLDLSRDLLQLSGISEEYLAQVDQGLEPSVSFDDLSADTKRAILERFEASAGDLELLIERLKIAEDELSLVSSDSFLAPVASTADSLYTDIVQSRRYLETLAIAANVLPELTGIDGEKTHLLLFLNNNELRPGGGFIGSYGVLRLQDGDISELETADVYTLDDAASLAGLVSDPPDALQRYNATSTWFFRDSNWSPDFATSSVWSIEQFLKETSLLSTEQRDAIPSASRIDGVIGLTPTFVSDLLTILGDIVVSGQTFTAENVADLLEYQVQVGYVYEGLPPEQRKEILADLINEVKTRLFSLPLSGWGDVIDVITANLKNKQIALYSSNQAVEDIFTRVGWGGRVLPETPDVQMVIDANLASLKSDPVVDRTITYQLGKNQQGDWVGRTTIEYDHTGTFDWKTTRYRTYTRLYVPSGTKLVAVRGSMLNDITQNPTRAKSPIDEGEELGLAVFGAFIAIEPGEKGKLIFEYLLSDSVIDSIKEDEYSLTIYKQMGSRDHALTLGLDFDKTVTHASPAEDSGEWGNDTYILNTILDQDVKIEISL